MPLQRCQAEGLSGWRWGKRGRCYTGGNARARALKQARAIRASGFTGNVHRRIRTQIVPSNPLKADPTRSATLRRIFTTDFTRRFFALKSKILRLIVDEDAFGLRQGRRIVFGSVTGSPSNEGLDIQAGVNPASLSFNKEQSDENQAGLSETLPASLSYPRVGKGDRETQESLRLESASLVVSSTEVLGGNGTLYSVNQRWAFQTDPQKVASFQQWLATQIQTDILTTTAENLENVYWQRYVEEGYRKGAGRAFDDTRKAALSSGADVSDFYQGTREEFLRSAFAQPVAIEKVKLLTGRVFTDLKGVTEAMSAQITRTLADGLVQGQNPRKIASDLNKIVDGIGKRRAMLIARTEIIRAHAEGQLDAFERLGVTKLGVMVEWSTAGDDRVCPLCEPLEGTVITLKEARGILPRHPQCRCAYIPANVGESTKGQNRSPAEVRKAMDDSIRAEIPKRQAGKRTLAQQKNRTPWAGADKTIAKKRPRGILEPAKVTPRVSPKPKAVVKPKPKAVAKPTVVTPKVLPKTRRQAELENLKSKELVRGSHHGQVDATFYVENPEGLPIAKIDYSELGEAIHVEMIEVLPEFKRRGVATEMFKRFSKENPRKRISWGMLTDEGAALKASLERQGILKPIPSLAKTKPSGVSLGKPKPKAVVVKPRKVTPTPVKPVKVAAKSRSEVVIGKAVGGTADSQKRLQAVTETMLGESSKRLQSGLKKVTFHSDSKALAKFIKREGGQMPPGHAIRGWFDEAFGEVHLVTDGSVGEYAHELAHVVDSRLRTFTFDPKWREVWKSEVRGGQLTQYATTDAGEGFAEYARLVFSNRREDQKRALKEFPKAWAYWKGKGLR